MGVMARMRRAGKRVGRRRRIKRGRRRRAVRRRVVERGGMLWGLDVSL